MFSEDTFCPLYQFYTPYVSNCIAEDGLSWKITGDVSVQLLLDIEHFKWITRDFVDEATTELSFWHESVRGRLPLVDVSSLFSLEIVFSCLLLKRTIITLQ
jgi:hypothetical protein